MNVYDFDGTIFPGDCSIGFGIWCMNRHPVLWLTQFPRTVWAFVQYKRGKIENFYSDSLADTSLALCADHAHLVIDDASTVVNWPKLDELTKEKVRKKIDTGWSIHLE